MSGTLKGREWQSDNLKDAIKCEIVGNVFLNPELLNPPAEDEASAA